MEKPSKKRSLRQVIKSLEVALEKALVREQILVVQLKERETLPVFDKHLLERLLETVYAAKGGMARWGR